MGQRLLPTPGGASVIQDIVDVSALLERTSTRNVTRLSFPKTRRAKSPLVDL
jgi:hypothetical protein